MFYQEVGIRKSEFGKSELEIFPDSLENFSKFNRNKKILLQRYNLVLDINL